MQVKVKRLSETAVLPIKAHPEDAGFDLTCSEITTELNECGQLILVYHSGIAIEIPKGFFGLVVPRSSVAKKSLTLTNCAGIIDSNYRGEVLGKFRATTDVIPAVYKVGERFAQLLILPLPEVEIIESEELSSTDRGDGGYGSTGNSDIHSAPMQDGSHEVNPDTNQPDLDGSGGASNGPEQA